MDLLERLCNALEVERAAGTTPDQANLQTAAGARDVGLEAEAELAGKKKKTKKGKGN